MKKAGCEKIHIRNAQKSDLKELQGLFVETINHICKKDYSPAQINEWTSSVNNSGRWLNALTTQFFIVAEMANRIVGFASLENYEYLDFLYVHKDFQRIGIAEELYTQIENEVIKRGIKVMYSDVSITACPFFEKKGFVKLNPQIIKINNVEIMNYRMRKDYNKLEIR